MSAVLFILFHLLVRPFVSPDLWEVDNLPFPEELDGIVDIGIVGKA